MNFDERIKFFNLSSYGIIYYVNAGLAIELYLKSILTKNNIKFNREHDIESLFMLLPTNIKKLFFRYFVFCSNKNCLSVVVSNETEFLECLHNSANMLDKYRYYFTENIKNDKEYKINFLFVSQLLNLLLNYQFKNIFIKTCALC